MILDTEILVRWNGRNSTYYKSKGYTFTKQGDEFIIKIEDLNPTSHIKINVKCDNCGENKQVKYCDYLKRKKDNYYCSACATKLFGSSTRVETLLKNSISFADYCIKNTDSDFINKYWSDKNIIDPYSISYSSKTKIWIKCQNKEYHQDYKTKCSRFTQGIRCPYCGGTKLHPKDSLGSLILELFGDKGIELIWSDKNKISPFKISQTNGKQYWWKCKDNKHEDFTRRVSDMKYSDFSCPSCSRERTESYLQEKVRLHIANNYDYTLLHERDCTILPINPKTKYSLPFDNEIKELKLILEVNGEQHYNATGFENKSATKNGTTPQEELDYLQWKDSLKKNYALLQGYHYLELPYTYFKDDKYKNLIDTKITDILNMKKEVC